MAKDEELRWWCTPCNGWRRPLFQSQIGTSCSTCRSGRIRPPLPGELPKPVTRPPA